MKYDRSSSSSIPVESESEGARWTRGRSRCRARPLDAVEVDGRPRSVFVADEVLVDCKDHDLISELVERYGAEIVPRKPLPRPPEGMGPKSGVDVEGMPLPALLRVKHAPAPSKRGAELLRASFSKNMSMTSERAARLAGLVAELAADSKQVGLNGISTTTALSLLNPKDWIPVDSLSVDSYQGKARVAAAWQLIEVFREFRSTKPVTIGILDAGFWLNGFNPGVANGQPGSDLGSSVIQLNLLDEGVSAGGASGIPNGTGYDSPWHVNAPGEANVQAAEVIIERSVGFE